MIHVLVSSRREELAAALRETAGDEATFLSARGLDDTLERLSRSARVDAVATDDPEVLAAIREEIPGALPVFLAGQEQEAAAIWQGLRSLLNV